MCAWKLTIEYDGTRYHGWQEQKNARTIAREIRQAAEDLFHSRVEIGGAGRTDAGVHALAQVARLRVSKPIHASVLLRELNNRLPADINILQAEEVRHSFNARHDATARYYLYQISTRRSAFAKKYVWWIRDSLDVEKMQAAAQLLIGRHDYSAFADKRSDEQSSVVVVEKSEIMQEGDLLLFRIGASHFLWKMVRRVVGALVEVGRGKLSLADFAKLLESSRNKALKVFDVAAHTAPPSGLFLERVRYEDEKQNDIERTLPLTPLTPHLIGSIEKERAESDKDFTSKRH